MNLKYLFPIFILFSLFGLVFFLQTQGAELCFCSPTESSLIPTGWASLPERNLEKTQSEAWLYFAALIGSLDSMDSQLRRIVDAASDLQTGLLEYQCNKASSNCADNQSACPAPSPACLGLANVEPSDFQAKRQALKAASDSLEQKLKDLEFDTTINNIRKIADENTKFKECQSHQDTFLLTCGELIDFKIKKSCNFSSVFCVK